MKTTLFLLSFYTLSTLLVLFFFLSFGTLYNFHLGAGLEGSARWLMKNQIVLALLTKGLAPIGLYPFLIKANDSKNSHTERIKAAFSNYGHPTLHAVSLIIAFSIGRYFFIEELSWKDASFSSMALSFSYFLPDVFVFSFFLTYVKNNKAALWAFPIFQIILNSVLCSFFFKFAPYFAFSCALGLLLCLQDRGGPYTGLLYFSVFLMPQALLFGDGPHGLASTPNIAFPLSMALSFLMFSLFRKLKTKDRFL